MKKFIRIGMVIGAIMFVIESCHDEPVSPNQVATTQSPPPPQTPPPPPPPVPPPPPLPTDPQPPSSFAGFDLVLELPISQCTLSGGANDPNSNIKTFAWRQISGPSSASIVRPDTLETIVRGLVQGKYLFELMVTDSTGLSGKDTMVVRLGQIPANPTSVELYNQNWTCLWGCDVIIEQLNQIVPDDKVFRIYIKDHNAVNWDQVVPPHLSSPTSIYVFALYGNRLFISLREDLQPNGWSDVRIVF